MTDSDRWQDRAACVGLTWWWDVGQRAAAARTCAGCPVVVPCLVDAFAANIDAERRDREAAIADAATIAEACTPGTPACAAATQRHERAVAALDQPPTGHTRADHGTWGGTGARARRQGGAAWRTGGHEWDTALAAHLDWLATEHRRTGRLTAHPWNKTGREQITHGLPGAYNHCTTGPAGQQCDRCRLAKALHTDRRRTRTEGTAA